MTLLLTLLLPLLLKGISLLLIVPDVASLSEWIDPDTPSVAWSTLIPNGSYSFSEGPLKNYTLIFSDEFNEDKRKFASGFDKKWTAIENRDYSNMGKHYFTPTAVQTDRGNLIITTTEPLEMYQDAQYLSGSLQGWNKFCFTFGLVEVRATLPGKWGIPGTWPAIWVMGNLGRASFLGSQEGTWPWSFDSCAPWVEKLQKKKQLISACNNLTNKDDPTSYPPKYGFLKNQGRGATEIDVMEAQISSKGQPAMISTSLQISPSLPDYMRPMIGALPEPHQWYSNLSLGQYTQLNKAYYGDPGLDSISALTQLNPDSYEEHHIYRMDWRGDYIRWWYDDIFLFEILDVSLGIRRDYVPPRQIPREPSYVILSTAVSERFSPPCSGEICKSIFPSNFSIDYVRVYQDTTYKGSSIGCNPTDYPTENWIISHPVEFGLPWYVGIHLGQFLLQCMTLGLLVLSGYIVHCPSTSWSQVVVFLSGCFFLTCTTFHLLQTMILPWMHMGVSLFVGVVLCGLTMYHPLPFLGMYSGILMVYLMDYSQPSHVTSFSNSMGKRLETCIFAMFILFISSFLPYSKWLTRFYTRCIAIFFLILLFNDLFFHGQEIHFLWNFIGNLVGGNCGEDEDDHQHHLPTTEKHLNVWYFLVSFLVVELVYGLKQMYKKRNQLKEPSPLLLLKSTPTIHRRQSMVYSYSTDPTMNEIENGDSLSSSSTYNYFDPQDLPENLYPFRFIYPIAENLTHFFGFQMDNAENQMEHVLLLLSNHTTPEVTVTGAYKESNHTTPVTGAYNEKEKEKVSLNYHHPLNHHQHDTSLCCNDNDSCASIKRGCFHLHSILFSNYHNWCKKLKLSCQSSEEKDSVDDLVVDICLLMLIWGEASNLRHTPEFLCYLFHKMKKEYGFYSKHGKDGQVSHMKHGKDGQVSHMKRESGYFMDNVISPAYAILKMEMRLDKDHEERRNYDDFNEFFWNANCLVYDYDLQTTVHDESASRTYVIDAYRNSKKSSFIEKRSWLSPLHSFRRVYEFHILSFHILVCVAFAQFCQWNSMETLQLTSSLFILPFVLSILWKSLHLHLSMPKQNTMEWKTFQMFLLRILIHLGVSIILLISFSMAWINKHVQQYPQQYPQQQNATTTFGNTTTTFGTTTTTTTTSPSSSPLPGRGAVPLVSFEWKCYWSLSLLFLFPYLLNSILQLVPSLLSYTRKTNILMIRLMREWFNPLNKLYIGDDVLDSSRDSLGYQCYWISMIVWKLYFSYHFEILPLVEPTLVIYFDHGESSVGMTITVLLILMQWLPFLLVYLVDLTIWNALWMAITGIFVGFNKKIGEIRNFDRLRVAFSSAADAFNQKLVVVAVVGKNLSGRVLSSDDKADHKAAADHNNATNNASFPASSTTTSFPTSFPTSSTTSFPTSTTTTTRWFEMNEKLYQEEVLVEEAPSTQNYIRKKLDWNELKALRIKKWKNFSTAWDAIISNMRLGDLISDKELIMLSFVHLKGLPREIYLPEFELAGCFESVCNLMKQTPSQKSFQHDGESSFQPHSMGIHAIWQKIQLNPMNKEAMEEIWELMIWVLTNLLGPCHSNDIQSIIHLFQSLVHKKTSSMDSINFLLLGKTGAALADIVLMIKKNLSTWKATTKELPIRRSPLYYEQFNQTTTPSHLTTLPFSGNTTLDKNNNNTLITSTITSGSTSIVESTLIRSSSTTGLASLASSLAAPNKIPRRSRGSGVAKIAAMQQGKSSSTLFNKKKPHYYNTTTTTTTNKNNNYYYGTGKTGTTTTTGKTGFSNFTSRIPSQDIVQIREKVRFFLNLVKEMVYNSSLSSFSSSSSNPEMKEVTTRLTWILTQDKGFMWDDPYTGEQLTLFANEPFAMKITNHLNSLLSLQKIDAQPKSHDAKRRLLFFINSLFMEMPLADRLESMSSYSVMTPFYAEDVLYSKSDLERKTDGLDVDTLLYLQTLYKQDWQNFIERVKPKKNLWKDSKTTLELRLWASLRGQTLVRTVQGMMYAEQAIRLLGKMENLSDSVIENLIKQKFTYVVACQIYGKQKRNNDSKAKDIEFLLDRYPNLRVAYIEEVRINYQKEHSYFAVLCKKRQRRIPGIPGIPFSAAAGTGTGTGAAGTGTKTGTAQAAGTGQAACVPVNLDDDDDDVMESLDQVYRIRLPGNPILGEGKPENQNSAIVFTRGQHLQTIDMNQDGYIEEALKLRNVLKEFQQGSKNRPNTIVGLPEHIFTGSVSSLANYMALQETSFVTLGQRTLAHPLRIRLHYGHPDIFNKLFFITRGGISKASRGINLSEDIFAGYNNGLRGGSVAFPEYLKFGKGRDVGMQQIYKFEAKLAQGAAEQSLSRDVYRLGDRLDFFKLLSFYFNHVGFYINTSLIIWTVYTLAYLNLLRSLLGAEKIGGSAPHVLSQLQVMLGTVAFITTAPLVASITVERGFKSAIREVLQVVVTGGPLYFLFHIGTKWFYYGQTILAGGAKYRATGRGFVTKHATFDELFRFYASSHLYSGIEIGIALMLFHLFSVAHNHFALTWSLWLVVISWVCSPFWFNPLAFEWGDVNADIRMWQRWMQGEGGSAAESWEVWFKEENAYFYSMNSTSKFCVCLKGFLYFIIGASLITCSDPNHTLAYSWYPALCLLLVLLISFLCCLIAQHFKLNESGTLRFLKMVVVLVVVLGIILILSSIHNTIYVLISLSYFVAAFGNWILVLNGGDSKLVQRIYFIHDNILGGLLLLLLIILAACYVPGKIQTWLLFNNALSRGVVIEDILRTQSKDDDDSDITLNQMKSVIIEQQKSIQALLGKNTHPDHSSTDTIMENNNTQHQQHHHGLYKMEKDLSSMKENSASDTDLTSLMESSQRLLAAPLAPTPPSNGTRLLHSHSGDYLHGKPPIRIPSSPYSTLNE